ncbi:hypothetical protein [Thermospira aquatica]|uniref:Uncharacterized protein n=1 Tax=Thermospira aquatica TaxID=2828656 RepID=A0AAX3BCY6_9SPIR|nr:hypothetical protein [Thermospira aquatica]URA10147.1 hypothetical protein KDW03_11805 [Thermospira aquatica]
MESREKEYNFLVTRIENYFFSIYYDEIKEISLLSKERLQRKRLADTMYEVPHIYSSNDEWIPLLDFQLLLDVEKRKVPQFAALITDNGNKVKYAVCFPHSFDEKKIAEKDIFLFSEFLLKKQFLPVFYGLVYVDGISSLFLSFCEIVTAVEIVNGIFYKKKGVSYDSHRRN